MTYQPEADTCARPWASNFAYPQRSGRQRLEGVTTCVNYADFLGIALAQNLAHFDEFAVVTSADDHRTKEVCQRHGVICVETDVFFEDGDRFNKGMAINLALAHLHSDGWLVHLDSDIVLPDRFRTMLDKARLDEACIYGADRVNVVGYAEWERIQDHPHFQSQFHHQYLVNVPDGLELGARLLHNELGYCPIGYFQLWHSSAQRRYPINPGSAEHSDVLFAAQWPARQRRLLPTAIVFHLESEPARMGANWKGRRTRPFTP